jgi:uncharacterized membrane protein
MAQPQIILRRVAGLALWLATIALGIADVYFVREIFFGVYARLARETRPALLFGNVIVVLAAIVLVAFIVISTEYHRKHFGKHESWDLFAWTLVVELAIPFIAVFLV